MAFTYAGRYGAQQVINATGAPLPNKAVNVYLTGTTTPAALYTDRTKATGASNPLNTDALGNLTFFADPGTYDLAVAGIATVETVTVSFDPAEPNPGPFGSGTYVPWKPGGAKTVIPVGTVQSGISQSVKGGILIGGAGPGVEGTLLGSSGNPSWVDFMASRGGAPTQVQVYSRGWLGEATTVNATNTITIGYGAIPSQYWSELYVGMPVGFNGKVYKIASVPTSGTALALTNFDGSAVSFSGAVTGTFKIAYEVSEGVCNTNGTAVTWVSGDYFHAGFQFVDQTFINGTMYATSVVPSQTSLTLTTSAGVQTGVPFKQISVDSSGYVSLLRVQGVAGTKEDNVAVLMTMANQARVETFQSNLQTYPDLVFGTGPDTSLPGTVSFNTSKQHLRITPAGEVQVGAYFTDPYAADLLPGMYTLTADTPKFAAYRYSATTMGVFGTTRTTLARFGIDYYGNGRTLDIASYNNFFGPHLQGRQSGGSAADIAAQPEGGNFVVGGSPATTATAGWLWISATSGAPTGVPATTGWSGPVPIVYDKTNNKLWVYNGAWKGVVLA